MFEHAAVAADHRIASEAGVEILKAGGNAVDAAVAASFCLSVVRPYSCGIGGGGFMIVRLKGDPKRGDVTTAINYREKAPAATTEDEFDRLAKEKGDTEASTHGGRAVAVPGNVAGLLIALEKYGTMTREQVLAPAIRAAESGFAVDAHYVESNQEVIEWIKKHKGAERLSQKDVKPTLPPTPSLREGASETDAEKRFAFVWEQFLKRGAIKVGDVVKLPEQAKALRLIAESGAAAFYEGEIGEAIVRAVKADGGVLSREDLRAFAKDGVKEVPPFVCKFRGRTILTMPPPSSGGIVLAQVFGMLEDRAELLDAAIKAGPNSAPYIHLITEAGKHAFADRARWLGDTDVVDVPLAGLLSPKYVQSRADKIDMTRTLASDDYGTATPPPEDHGTSHLCAIDRWGGAVSCTETINLYFGSLVCVPEFGFALNNEMDDFQARLGHANAFGLEHASKNRPAPGKRPLSSMTPMIAMESGADGAGGRVVLMAGGSGGPRIISGTMQVALNVLLFDLSGPEAVKQARFHHQWHPDQLDLEAGLRGGAVEEALKALGHKTAARAAIGAVQMIRWREGKGGGWEAASDPRKGGVAAGY